MSLLFFFFKGSTADILIKIFTNNVLFVKKYKNEEIQFSSNDFF